MSTNLFGGSGKDDKEFATKVDTHSKTLVTVIQRQKDIESLLENINEKTDMIDHNSVLDFKKVFSKLKTLSDEISDLKSEIKKIKDFQDKITKQMRLFSTIDEVKKLEKYIDLWEPLNFVNRDEIQELFEKQKNEVKEMSQKSQKETVEKITKIIEEYLK